MKSPEPIIVEHSSVGVLGTMQPDKLPCITGGADDGLAARFLWVPAAVLIVVAISFCAGTGAGVQPSARNESRISW